MTLQAKLWNNFPIYVACPMSVPEKNLYAVVNELRSAYGKNSVKFWVRGSYYNKNVLIGTKAMVVMLPDNGFEKHCLDIPAGTLSEIKFAEENDIPLFLAYKPAYRANDQSYSFYEADYDASYVFRGIPGSYNDVWRLIKEAVEQPGEHEQNQRVALTAFWF